MNSKAQKLFDAFHMFRKLQIPSLLENLNHSELSIMKALKYGDFHRPMHNIEPKVVNESPLSVSKLAKLVRVSAPSISRSLKGMEEKGYIIRKIDSKDRRNSYVELTDYGKSTLEEAEKTIRDFTDSVIEQMDPTHLEQLMSYLEELYTISENEILKRKEQEKREKKGNK